MSVNCWLEITNVGSGETAQGLELVRTSLSEDTESPPNPQGGRGCSQPHGIPVPGHLMPSSGLLRFPFRNAIHSHRRT